jgi:activator of 2-hydroxyglutaryl-CoA dehydratase
MDAVETYLDGVVERLVGELLPELADSHRRVRRRIFDQPVVLTGGMACIPGFVAAFERRANEALDEEIEATAPERAELAATIGAQRIATRLL